MSESQTTATEATDYDALADAQYEAEMAALKSERRAQFIAGIRAMADFLENNESAELPYSLCGSVYAETAEDARRITHLTGAWSKTYDDYGVSYTKRFAEPSSGFYTGSVRYVVTVPREQVCERIQVGTKHVEAQIVEAHDEPVYEWKCSDTDEITPESVDFAGTPEGELEG